MTHAAIKAQCLCGAVELSAVPENDEAGVCHCSMCQRWAGGISILRTCSELVVVKGDALGIYESSEWGERGFCRNCGSSLFWRAKEGGHSSVSASAFENYDGLRLTSEIFYDRKPAFYALANDTKKMTEAETIAFFTGAGAGDANEGSAQHGKDHDHG
ncbi:GFA family protein [Pseudochelatococcus contaminans]|uniref:CENP-V/GFA domain-containing protein n=1 Tax=Pseudochelatococcus contaminans TaxID=1538103 RepID=A0A7W6EF12_9HYPH|nr:GFA family protein [Pseudochelatococcus contaminans]MBB3808460.1 hypothetical protein [Pseudochelatococcus contaminans]